jgi:hypothetical protein
VTVATATRRLAGILAWSPGCHVGRNCRDGGSSRNAVRMRRGIKRMVNRRFRRLDPAWIDEQEAETGDPAPGRPGPGMAQARTEPGSGSG